MKNKKYLSMALALAVMATSSSVLAAEVADFGDEDVVVTATRTEKKDLDIPAATKVITGEQMKEKGYFSATEALAMENGFVYSAIGPMGMHMGTSTSELNVRGFQSGVQVLVNGNPIAMRGKYDLSAISADTIDRIEIVKGTGSLMYGSDAISGIVNIITKKSAEKSNVTFGYGNRKNSILGANLYLGKLGIHYNEKRMEKSYAVSDPSVVSSTTAIPKNAVTTNYYLRDMARQNATVTYKFDDRFDVYYNYSMSNGWIDRNILDFDAAKDYSKMATPDFAVGDLWQTRKWEIAQHIAQVNFRQDNFKASAYVTNGYMAGKADRKDISVNTPYYTKEHHVAYGLDAQNKWKLSDKANIIAGASFKRESAVNMDISKDTTNFDRNIFGLFTNWEQKFDEKNSFNLGGRYTWTTNAFRSQNYNNFSASGSWLHKMNEENSLYLSVAQSFIMPTFNQMYTTTDSQSPNPDLKPQRGINYELGWKQEHGSHIWKAALFHMDVKDNITPSKLSGEGEYYRYKYDNVDFKNTGIELSCTIDGGKSYSYNYGITWQHPMSKSTKKGYWDDQFGQLQLTGGIGYKTGKFKTNLSASYLCNRKMTPTSTRSYDAKPYLLTTWNFIYSPTDDSDIVLTIDNVLDRRDNTKHTSTNYYTAPRTFLLSYNYKF